MERVSAGERLSADEIRDLAATPDILPLGMLADVLRRRRARHADDVPARRRVRARGSVARTGAGQGAGDQDHRLAGATRRTRYAALEVVKSKGDRTVSAFTWSDVERMASGASIAAVLKQLRGAGLDSLSELPLDGQVDPALIVNELAAAGFTQLRLTVDKAPADRVPAAAAGRGAAGPRRLHPGDQPAADDVVHVPADHRIRGREDGGARAAGGAEHSDVQVDWPRYGPKLAQVALTFGADESTACRRRTTRRKDGAARRSRRSRRNIQAAGFEPVERDGRFTVSHRHDVAVRDSVRSGYLECPAADLGASTRDCRSPRWHVRYDLPSVCAALLQDGEVDLGLMPSIEYLQRPTTASCPASASARAGRRVGGALHARAGRADRRHRARHQLAHVGGADPGAVPSPLPDQPEFVPHGPRPRGDDARTTMPGC